MPFLSFRATGISGNQQAWDGGSCSACVNLPGCAETKNDCELLSRFVDVHPWYSLHLQDSGRLTSFISTLQGLYFFSALFVLSVSAVILCVCVVCCSHFMDCISEKKKRDDMFEIIWNRSNVQDRKNHMMCCITFYWWGSRLSYIKFRSAASPIPTDFVRTDGTDVHEVGERLHEAWKWRARPEEQQHEQHAAGIRENTALPANVGLDQILNSCNEKPFPRTRESPLVSRTSTDAK